MLLEVTKNNNYYMADDHEEYKHILNLTCKKRIHAYLQQCYYYIEKIVNGSHNSTVQVWVEFKRYSYKLIDQ